MEPTNWPTKAMDRDPSIEFDHFLAQKLGMTVQEMLFRMSNAEYVRWSMYYARIAQRQELAK
jgi:hypothetical protein